MVLVVNQGHGIGKERKFLWLMIYLHVTIIFSEEQRDLKEALAKGLDICEALFKIRLNQPEIGTYVWGRQRG